MADARMPLSPRSPNLQRVGSPRKFTPKATTGIGGVSNRPNSIKRNVLGSKDLATPRNGTRMNPSNASVKRSHPMSGKLNHDFSGHRLNHASPRRAAEQQDERAGAVSTQDGPDMSDPDDTRYSAFSAVSADITKFHRGLQIPATDLSTPRQVNNQTSRDYRDYVASPAASIDVSLADCTSPTLQGIRQPGDGDTTNLLVDFTGNYTNATQSRRQTPSRHGSSPSKATFAQSRLTHSPFKSTHPSAIKHDYQNLLDFDLPPAPTPRSTLSISSREFESMKADLMAQNSALRMKLEDGEMKIRALVEERDNSEQRVSQLQDRFSQAEKTARELQVSREDLLLKHDQLNSAHKELQSQIDQLTHQRDDLTKDLRETTQRLEHESTLRREACNKNDEQSKKTPIAGSKNTSNADIEAAVINVSKELHELYKKKHEDKVALLKESYSERWSKRVKDLQTNMEKLAQENQNLRMLQRTDEKGPSAKIPESSLSERNDKTNNDHEARSLLMQNQLEKLQQHLTSSEEEKKHLTKELEKSHAEINELVTATEELMQLSASSAVSQDAAVSISGRNCEGGHKAVGQRSPGFGPKVPIALPASKIGLPKTSGPNREYIGGNTLGIRSGIMSNIERMGRGRGLE